MSYSADFSNMIDSIVVPMSAALTSEAVIMNNSYKEFNRDRKRGDGETMGISIPDPGVVSTGAAFSDETDLSITSAKKEVTLVQSKVGVRMDVIKQSLSVKNEQQQIIIPRAQNLCSYVQKTVANNMLTGFGMARVMTATKEFDDMSYAVADIDTMRYGGKIVGALNPVMMGKVIASGMKNYNPDPIGTELYNRKSLGSFAGADWFKTPDIIGYTQTSLPALGSGTTLKAAVTFTSGKATEAVFTVAGGTATLTGDFLAGTPFQITGINCVDPLGNDSGIPYTFYVSATVTAGSNTATVTLANPVYISGPNKNINTAANISATAATFLLTAGKTYARGLVWGVDTLAVGEGELDDLDNCETFSVKDPKGFNLKATRFSSGISGYNGLRIDTLSGSTILRNTWGETLFWQTN